MCFESTTQPKRNYLDPKIHACLQTKKKCRGYEITPEFLINDTAIYYFRTCLNLKARLKVGVWVPGILPYEQPGRFRCVQGKPPFDLVITDMIMPNMTGDRLAEELISIRPDFPVIICTGFSERINKEKLKLSE